MKKGLKKPSFIQLFIGLINTNLHLNDKYKSYGAPLIVSNYKLLYEINKESKQKDLASAVYICRSKKYFIKTWFGMVKDLRYYSLINELFTGDILYKEFDTSRLQISGYNIKIPKVITCVRSPESLSVVFEFVAGVTLTNSPLAQQVKVLGAVIEALQYVSKRLSSKEKSFFLNISKRFYLLSLPLLTLCNLIFSGKGRWAIFRAFIDCLNEAKSLKPGESQLAHRDIEPPNILVDQRNIYIVDCERMALTIPNYDINHLSIKPGLKLLAKKVFYLLNQKQSLFLKNYISIQFASTPDNPPYFKNFYIRGLLTRYAKKSFAS